MAIKNARDVYTRRNEGVSIWVGAARPTSSPRRPGDQRGAVRAGEQQGLPASDVLPDARRSEAHLSADAARSRDGRDCSSSTCCASAIAAGPRAAPRRVGRQGAGARGGHRAHQRRRSTCSARRGCGSSTPARSRRGSGGTGRNEDELAFLRDARRVPQPAAGRAAERQLRRHDRAAVPVRRLAPAAAARARALERRARRRDRRQGAKEVAYHVERSGDWVIRLGDGTDESHARMQAAIDGLWTYTGEMFARRRGRARAGRTRASRADVARARGAVARSTSTRCSPRRR